jgi:predicted glycoside hydrolase/deacetylase ChbG (UPF0249 family)
MTHVRPRQIIVTGDDLGQSAEVSAAVLEALERGWITHASLLANLPHAADACAAARARGVADRVGLHVNFSEGAPLTEALRTDPMFCAGGEFLPVERFTRYRSLDAERRRRVADEVRAQHQRMLSHGIRPSHVDSHNDVHTAPSIAPVVLAVARELGIARLRPARNCGTRQGVLRRVQHRAYNAWLRRAHLCSIRFLGTVDDMEWLARAGRLTPDIHVEVVTHPRPGPASDIVDAPSPHSMARQSERLQACFGPG